MLLHRCQWCQDAQIALHPLCVVVKDVILDHLSQLMLAGKTPAVISFSLQNAPEALHRAVINAMCYAGHTLCHPGLNKLVVKCPVGILKASVAVE